MYSISEPFVTSISNKGHKQIGAEGEIFLLVWYLANTETFRQLGNLFGVSASSAWNIVVRTTSWMISIGHQYIKWPQGDDVIRVEAKFRSKRQIPGVIGAIDGSHIRIRAPKEHKTDYCNRKKYFSVVLQAICDADKLFTDIYCGEPGSMHDNRVLKRSDFYRSAVDNTNDMFPDNTFIIGDSAYALHNWLIPPFKDTGLLTDEHIQFNFLHSSTRMVIEQAFGLLKGRFRRILHFIENYNIPLIVNVIVSCCILHNICILKDDFTVSDDDSNDDNNVNNYPSVFTNTNTVLNRRNELLNHLITTGIIE